MRFDVLAVCRSCKGTGLYVGLGERDGWSVVCHTCKGSGAEHISLNYEPFEKRIRARNVKRVLRVNPGIVAGIGAHGQYGPEAFGGCSFEEWERDAKAVERVGTEMRAFTCPAWWYQSADYTRKPSWNDVERRCNYGRFSACEFFPEKAGCWAKWDRENGRDGTTPAGGEA